MVQKPRGYSYPKVQLESGHLVNGCSPRRAHPAYVSLSTTRLWWLQSQRHLHVPWQQLLPPLSLQRDERGTRIRPEHSLETRSTHEDFELSWLTKCIPDLFHLRQRKCQLPSCSPKADRDCRWRWKVQCRQQGFERYLVFHAPIQPRLESISCLMSEKPIFRWHQKPLHRGSSSFNYQTWHW